MKPRVQDVFWNITLSTSKSDIKFMNGEPTKIENNVCSYKTDDAIAKDWTEYRIGFKHNLIWYVWYSASSWNYPPDLKGIGYNDSSNEIINKFGEPTHTSSSDDQLVRLYSYDSYHAFFGLMHDRVFLYGMFNPTYGPLEFETNQESKK